jgi:hypothetical protein
MAWTFNGTGSQVRIPDGSHLDIPNGDWSFAGWFRVSDNSDSNYKRLLAWGAPGGTPHVQVFLPGTGLGATNNDHLGARFIGTGGADTGILYSPGFAISDHYDEWIAWCLTHEDATNTTYLRVLDRSTSTFYTSSNAIAIGSVNIAEDLYIGASNAGTDSTRWVGDMAEMSFFDGLYMNVNQFHGFVHGGRGFRFPECAWNLPMLGGREEIWSPGNSIITPNTVNVSTATYDGPQLQLITPRIEDTLEVILNQSADNTLNMTQNATGVNTSLTFDAANVMVIEDFGEGFNLVDDRKPCGNVMTLTQDVDEASNKFLEHDLGLTQTLDIIFPIKPSVQHVLGLTSHTSTPHRAWIQDWIYLSDFIPTPLPPQFVEHTLNLVSDAPIGRFDQSLNLTQTAVPAFALWISQNVNITDNVERTAVYQRSIEDEDVVGHALTWYEDTPCGRKQYTPFQGESTIPLDVSPPNDDLQDPQGEDGTFKLYQPYVGVHTSEVTLRQPELDNRDRNAFTRVSQETRGGKMVVYADPTWPKVRTLAVTIVGLTEAQVDELQSFMLSTVGQEIGLTDWEGRLWKGFISNPNEPATQDGRKMWTVSLQFEGEMLDVEQPGETGDGDGMAMNLSQSVTAVIV